MKNKLISENSWNGLILIASTIIFQLIMGLQQITHFSLMGSMMNIQFLLARPFIFPFLLLVTHRSALFPT